MAKNLTYQDIYEILSIKCHVSEVTVERVLKHFITLVANELQNNSYISLTNIGKFSTEMRGGSDEWIEDAFGTLRKRYVEPFQYINFEPSKSLLEVVNGESINYLFRKTKLKYDKPTSYAEAVDDKMKEEDDISDIIEQTLNKTKKKKNRRKNRKGNMPTNLKSINEQTQQPILCKNNNVVYPSVHKAAHDLGLAYTTLRAHTVGDRPDLKLNGYEFKLLENPNKKKKEEEEENNGEI